MPPNDRLAEVWAALASVADPELDQAVVDLGFITHVALRAELVEVAFRLPTFWCSANFAFIMAEDMRDALQRLEWVERTEVRLVDHYAADAINAGVAAGQSFGATFGTGLQSDLTTLRETFRRKAFYGRMSELIEIFRQRGWSDRAILDMRIADLRELQQDEALGHIVSRYLELRALYGGPHAGTDAAFRRAEGATIEADALPGHLRDIRMSRRSAEANGEMCRMLLSARADMGGPLPQSTPAARAGSGS